jgi:glutamine synthetase adenylyltransferase
MLYTQYTKQRNAKTWEKFRQQRNRIIFCSPELHFFEKKGLIVVQKVQVLAPPEQQRSKK